MSEYRHGSHTVFKIHLHLVWITKYRKKILTGDVATRVRDLIREICRREDVEIIQGHVSKDHVHLFVSLPPQVSISRFVQRLKGKTSYKLLSESEQLRKLYWGRHLWARGYFCCSSGDVTDEMIKQYIEQQHHDGDENFKVEGEGPSTT
jgi:REP-associated tyrosine transposase